MPDPTVRLDAVWKKFNKGERHDSLRDLVPALISRPFRRSIARPDLEAQEFWALRDLSFEVRPGESLGIIGPNGAGKSTVLKLLTKILRPTRGQCLVVGRAGALIGVSAGFHGDLTGRENVFLQGAILGMKRTDIARKFDQIVEFSGVETFLDTPVKRYSSGMNARLGFAIAAHLDPDVLFIDEALSVGDTAFRERSMNRMRELVQRGVPLVFVSHNLSAVQQLCSRVIVLNRGSVLFDGEPGRAIDEYRRTQAPEPAPAAGTNTPAPEESIRIAQIELLDAHGAPCSAFTTLGVMCVRARFESSSPIPSPSFSIAVHRKDGVHCVSMSTARDRHDLGVVEGARVVSLRIPQLMLLPGAYVISVRILDAATGTLHAQRKDACPFTVTSPHSDPGIVYMAREWSHGVP